MATKLFCDRCGVEIINDHVHHEFKEAGVHFVGVREADLCDMCKEDLKVFMANNQIAERVWVLMDNTCDHPIGIFDSKVKAENAKSVLEDSWADSNGVEIVYTVSLYPVR